MTENSSDKGLRHYLAFSLSMVMLIFVLALAVLIIVVPKATGSIPMTVLTSSMIPRYPPGTLVVIKKIDTRSLKIGDVATYQIASGKPGVITHRIVAINNGSDGKRSFVFRGDNNSVPDPTDILDAQVVGKLWYSLPAIGYVSNWLNGVHRGLLVTIAAALLLGYATFAIISGILGSLKKRRAGAE